MKKKNFQTNKTPQLSNSLCLQVWRHLVLGRGHSDQFFELMAQAVGHVHAGDALGLVDVDIHLQGVMAQWRCGGGGCVVALDTRTCQNNINRMTQLSR